MAALGLSVIIPTFNRARLLRRAVDSVLPALGPGDELIVVDDGSTDETPAIVKGLGTPVAYVQIPHAGAGAARNAGLDAAHGPLVAFLDSDDEWFPDKVTLQRSFLESRPDILFCFSDFGVRLEDGTEHHRYLRHWLLKPQPLSEVFGPGVPYSSIAALPEGRKDFPVYIRSMYLEEMRNNCMAAFTLMARKPEAGDALRFAEDLPTGEEWPAFGRLARLGPGALFDTETAWQHGHSGPRLTNLPQHILGSAWLTTLDRVWGRDSEFLAEHGDEYRGAVSAAHWMRARSLLRHGQLREAGRAMRLAGLMAVLANSVGWLAQVLKTYTPG